MDIMMQWRRAWSDATEPTFWVDLVKGAFGCIKKLFFVIAAVLFISLGAGMLSIPELLASFMIWLKSIPVAGYAAHFMLNTIMENIMLAFVLMACAPKKSNEGLWYYIWHWIAFLAVAGVVLNISSLFLPVALLDFVRIVMVFALFAWVYGKVAFINSFAVGAKMVIGSLPVVALATGMSMAFFSTQAWVLSIANQFVGWWGLAFIITTLYSLVRMALFITLYYKHAGYYVSKPRAPRGAPRGPRKRNMTPRRGTAKKPAAKKTKTKKS